jgi:hypothetical protein
MVHDMQGIPEIIVSDGSQEQTRGQRKKEVNLFHMKSFDRAILPLAEPFGVRDRNSQDCNIHYQHTNNNG